MVSVDDDLGYFVGAKAALLACENLEEALTRESVISPELWRNIAGVRACVRVVSDLIDQRDKTAELPGTDLLLERFRSLRADVDCENLLDTFDFALGWLRGLGVPHYLACDLASEWENLPWH